MVKVKTQYFSSPPPSYTVSGQNVDKLWTLRNPICVHFLSRDLILLKVCVSQYFMVGREDNKYWTKCGQSLDSMESYVCLLFVQIAYLMKDLYITVFLWLDIRETNFGQKNQTLSRVCHKIMQYARPSRVCLKIGQPDSAYHSILGLGNSKTKSGQTLGMDKIWTRFGLSC